jgi:hypothetical protein
MSQAAKIKKIARELYAACPSCRIGIQRQGPSYRCVDHLAIDGSRGIQP